MKQIQDDDVEALTSLGLTVLQAKVYLALIKTGSSTIKEISKTAGIARQDLYRITSELQQLGLVEKVIAIPAEFRPIKLTEGISILLQRLHLKEAETRKKTLELVQRHKDTDVKVKPDESEPLFIMIPEREATVQRTIEALENAKISNFSVVSWKKFSYLMSNYRKFRLSKAMKRGVKLRFITEKPENEKQIPKIVETYRKNYPFEVRYLPTPPPAHIGLFDNKEVFINTSTKEGLTETPLLWSNSSSLVAVVHDYFEILWLTAMETPKLNNNKKFKVLPK
jgi:sugar-specific transcriptional regulator TrmB